MRHVRIGDVEVTSIVERDGPWRTPEAFFPDWDADAHGGLVARLEPEMFDVASGRMVITYQTYVVRTPRRLILVDTCLGDDKGLGPPYDYPKQPWLDGFQALGLRFEDVDHVLCTHLHFDHTGWNTRLVDGRYVPTFPNARYVFHEREYAAWQTAVLDPANPQAHVMAANVEPIVAAGQAILADDGFALDDTVTLVPTPGHTPGHCCVDIASRGQRATITGDLFHHALQVLQPGLATVFCSDATAAIASRRRWLEAAAGDGDLVLPIHFPHPTAGRIVPDGDGLRYAYDRS